MPFYQSVGRSTLEDDAVMSEFSGMADSVLARHPATKGIVIDVNGIGNYLIVNQDDVRKIIWVDPFWRPRILEK
jgi:hypothetical protein